MNFTKPSMSWFLEDKYDVVVPRHGSGRAKVKCAWHDDRRASAQVFDDKQFRCFAGCFDGERVDVLDILQRTTGCSFQEAVEMTKEWPGEPTEGSASSNRRTRSRAKRGVFKFKIIEG